MLVLTRKTSEMIRIGDDIVVKVIRTGKTTVKIGIEAPADVRVLRAELCDEPEAEALPFRPHTAPRAVRAEALPTYAHSDQYPHVV